MRTRAALAAHRRVTGHPWPEASPHQLLKSFAIGARGLRLYDPGFPVAELAATLIREFAGHVVRLLTWPLRLRPVALPAVSSPFTVARWLPGADDSGWLCDLVRACPSNGPPAVVAALGAPVISP